VPGKISLQNYLGSNDQKNSKVANQGNDIHIPKAGEWSVIRAPLVDKVPEGTERKPRPLLENAKSPKFPSLPSDSDLSILNKKAKELEEQKNKILGTEENEKSSSGEGDNKMLPAYKLKWPPVQPDGSILPNEGTEIMPITGLAVPRFWEAAPGSDLDKLDDRVNGHETIFLMIASYRDFQCRETIASAFSRADHPERLVYLFYNYT
jgi:hypothetical protein